jgi:hypothetical protein
MSSLPSAQLRTGAGTHNHRLQLLKRSRQPYRFHNIGRGVWIPDRRSRCSLVRDDNVLIKPGMTRVRNVQDGARKGLAAYCAWGCFQDF